MKIMDAHFMPDTSEVGLFISGSETKRNLLCTCEELAKLDNLEKKLFSVYDNHENKESRDIEEGCGILLEEFLGEAGVAGVDEIKTKSIDGFESIVTELNARRMYYPGLLSHNPENAEPREALVSFYKNGEKAKFYPHPTIMFGQQGLDDKNKDFFAKGVRSVIAGARDRLFWVKGDGIRCNRYFGAEQLFELPEQGKYLTSFAELHMDDTSAWLVPAVKLPEYFWSQEIGQKDMGTPIFAVDKNGSEQKVVSKDGIFLFFTDETYKKVGFSDGTVFIPDFAGFRVGQISKNASDKENRVPSVKEDGGDFYIRIIKNKQDIAFYAYSLAELKERFADLIKEESYYYYDHNMDQKRGGYRRVTAHGFLLADLLGLLPEIPDPEMIENGEILFQIFTQDAFKEKIALEGSELSAYRFILAFELDQRTDTGFEKHDTSVWDDEELHFAPITGNTPFKIYCDKASANPAVYKNAAGMTVELI